MQYLVAVDGFEASERALTFARDQARETGATIDVVHVVDENGGNPETREQIRETVDAVMADTDVEYELHFPSTTKRTQPATKAGKRVLEFAEEHGSDVVYVGNEQTGTAERVIVGSVASTLIEARSIPVVLVPRDRPDG